MIRSILALGINDQSLHYVFVHKERTAWRVMCAGRYEDSVDIGKTGALSRAVESILAKEKILPQKLFLSVARRDSFIHQLTIPVLSGREIKGVVLNEIERNPDFMSRKFDFVYRVFPYKVEQQKVLFAALLHETVDALIEDVTATRLECHDLEVSPFSLRDVILGLANPGTSEDQGITGFLVVYENYTYLVIFDSASCHVFYKVPIGMAELASSNTLTIDETTTFFNQIRRILKSYESDHRSEALSSLWVVWDNARVKNLDQTLTRELGVKTNPLDLGVLKDFALSKDEQLNPVYILAMTPVIHYLRKAKANILSVQRYFLRSMHITRQIRRSSLAIVILVAVLTVLYAGFHFFVEGQMVMMKECSENVEWNIRDLKSRTRDITELYAIYRETRQRILQQATYVRELNRVSWSQVLAIVSQEMPQDLALTSFSFKGGGQAVIKGEAVQMETISGLIRKIDTSSILEKGSFDYLREREMRRSEGEENEKYYQFGITAQLRSKVEMSDDSQ